MTAPRNTRNAQRAGPDGRVIAAAVALVVVIAVVTALLVTGGDDGDAGVDTSTGTATDATDTASGADDPPADFGAVRVSGDPLPGLPDGGSDPALGMTGPAITSEQASGTTEVAPGDDDRPTMLVFLAHWCPHCQAELPDYVELAEQGELDELRTVAVLTSSDEDAPNFPPSAWLDDEGWTGERLFDDRDSTAAAAYGLTSFPYTVVLDAEGEVVDRFSGEQPAERILEAVEKATS